MTPLRVLPVLLLALLLAACGSGGSTVAEPPADVLAEGTDEAGDGLAAAADGSDGGVEAEADPDAPADTTAADDAASGESEAVVAIVSPDGDERVTFDVELAADQATRQRGLMERTSMPEDAGMLFLFPADSSGGFWMKNTLIPLQIAYIDAEGIIVSILDMVPCTEDPCEVYSPGSAYRSALEVNAGALDAAGISVGWRVEVPDDLPAAS